MQENVDWKTFSILPTVLLFVPPLCFTAISSFIQCYSFYVHRYEKPPNHFIPVVFIISIHRIITELRIKIMYITCKLFILELRLVSHSMLFILCSPDLRGGRSVLTRRLIITFTYVVCKHDGIIGRVNTDMWIVSWFYFILFIFNRNRCVSGHSSDSNCKSKSQKKSQKASGLPHMFGFKFLEMWKGIS